ncbi:MAG: hypothetical protein EXR72_10595 [Myxococcales bacterium]|nr:hypothetical protein [Myxococcales bacterium]
METLDALLERTGGYFVGKSPVHAAAEQIARHLDEEGIDYAIAGALSLGVHGYVRFTDDVDVLLTRDGLDRFKAKWLGRGYVNLREGGRPVRDALHGVKIDFLIAGDYPGDGKPKPVRFPDPATAAIPSGTFRVLALPTVVELKLASGLSAPHRAKDLIDIQELIRAAKLPLELADQLDSSVEAKYRELWNIVANAPADEY